ncbi:pectate lyase family protein [Segetibacter aerophilus]|uniref:Pectate lyase n=1 Tax=Segetibacter aerophilus TaxID=670293 RepID=A0A512BDW7_9BACT|nr:pectate lyase [Segetibacter aerophilus]GEO10149.1 pectate lyase [Segetibacter aerophilus]
MIEKLLLLATSIFYITTLPGCTPAISAAKSITGSVATSDSNIAFPGAEGFGKYTTGGRHGKVLIVSNLNDNGPGSLREAIRVKGPRIVVFTVSGTIHLESKLAFTSDLTIAGQSAPGDGICLADYPVTLSGNNIIVRYMRFRMGDKNQKGGMVAGNGGDDAFGGTHRNNIIVDHCSMSWSTDEVFSVYEGDSTTLQWNLISEPLNYSYHFENGDKDFEHHGYGGIWGGRRTSGHHNLFAHCANRTPRFDGIRNIPEEFVDFRNNVIYDWSSNNVYAGEGGKYNLVNNYYKPGPSTHANVSSRILNPYKKPPTIPYGKFYVDGNYVDGADDVTKNNWKGVVMNDGSVADAEQAKAGTAFPAEQVQTQSPTEAYLLVLQYAGASLRRDTLDERIINDVKNKQGRLIDVQGGFPHGTPYELTVNAWPTLKSLPAPTDTDKDGIPDEWEKRNALNPNDPTDATISKLHKHYTNIEVYLNSLVPKA